MPVGAMLDQISSRELSEWMQYAAVEPFGWQRLERVEVLLGQLLTLTANINRDSKRRSHAYELEDFMPWLEADRRRAKQQTWQEQLQMVEMLNAAFGGVDRRAR